MNRKIKFPSATAGNFYCFAIPSHGFDINIEFIYPFYPVWCEQYLIQGYRMAWETSSDIVKGKIPISYTWPFLS